MGPRIDRARIFAAEAGRAVLWLPVCFGGGVWIYFLPTNEPSAFWAGLGLLPAAALATGAARRAGWGAFVLAVAMTAAAAGFAVAMAQAHRVAAPMLAGPVTETVEGRVLSISRSASGAPRLLIDRPVVYGLEASETPRRIRITLVDQTLPEVPRIGNRVRTWARLFPPGGPVEPGAFDFRRQAFFDRLGAVGYVTGAAVLDLGPDRTASLPDRAALRLADVRAEIAAALRARLPGAEGAFAAAIVVGDRSAIAEDDAEALRAANLAHLLAISGLHMGMLTGLIFAAVRLGLAAVPGAALTLPTKKIAAGTALAVGAAYLALSGATVATQRAFIMVSVALVAVLLDRPALSLRALAVAAFVVLLLRPVSLLEAGFQMSFAATTVLIAGYEAARGWRMPSAPSGDRVGRLRRLALVYVAGIVVTSLLAGLATAPYAAAHFNRAAPLGLAANLAAVPVMGLVIAPMAAVAGLLAPFGLAGPALDAMGLGIAWVLAVAHEVASWPGAVRPVAAAPAGVLALVTLGGLWLALWRTGVRFAGLAPLALGLALWWAGTERPTALVGPGARLVGVLGAEGRAVDHPRAQGFVAETWLRRDGDLAPQEEASGRPGLVRDRGRVGASLGAGWRLSVVHSRRPEPADLRRLCQPGTILVARHGPATVDGPCRYFGEGALARLGALAITVSEGRPVVEGALSGDRLWRGRPDGR